MTYHTDNKIRMYIKGYGFMTFAKNFGSKYGKKFVNKGISASKIIKDSAQSKYGQKLKREFGKQLSDKTIPAAFDVAGSKIADKITSLKVKDEEPENNRLLMI